MIVLAALIVAAAIVWTALQVVAELRAARDESARARSAALLAMFAPALAEATRDPRAFLVWQPIAAAARQLYPAETAALDRASGGRFPFTVEQIQAAHAQWTADWLAWERAHDAEYKRKAASPTATRSELEAIEQEKLDLYQRRYAEYVRIAKALQALAP